MLCGGFFSFFVSSANTNRAHAVAIDCNGRALNRAPRSPSGPSSTVRYHTRKPKKTVGASYNCGEWISPSDPFRTLHRAAPIRRLFEVQRSFVVSPDRQHRVALLRAGSYIVKVSTGRPTRRISEKWAWRRRKWTGRHHRVLRGQFGNTSHTFGGLEGSNAQDTALLTWHRCLNRARRCIFVHFEIEFMWP